MAFEDATGSVASGETLERGIARVPGPPLLGALLPLRRNALEFFTRLLSEHGDRVQFRVLGRTVLLLSHPDDLEQILVRDRETYGRSAELRGLRPIFGDGLLASDGSLWRRQRSLIQPSFQHSAMNHYAGIMLDCISRQVSAWQPGQVRDIHRDMMRYTRETICGVLFGSEFSAENPGMGDAVSVVFGDLRAEILYLPLWRKLPLARSRRWNRAVRPLNHTIQSTIEARRASGEAGPDLLGDLLRARDGDGNAMSDQQVQDEIMTFFLAGHETAALSLSWAAYLLAIHAEAQEQAADEVHRITNGAELRAEDYPKLRYVTAVTKEALRLYPPVWSMGREAIADGTLAGHRVAKGTDLWLCIHRLHRDARWYQEPDRFVPERWLGDQVQRRFTYAPFGIGPRVCIGQHFAMAETVLGLAAMLRRYRFSLTSSAPAELSAWISLRPKRPIGLLVQPR